MRKQHGMRKSCLRDGESSKTNTEVVGCPKAKQRDDGRHHSKNACGPSGPVGEPGESLAISLWLYGFLSTFAFLLEFYPGSQLKK